jgi:hypothetical protein
MQQPYCHLGLPWWVTNVYSPCTRFKVEIINVDDKAKPLKKRSKKNYELFRKCQDSWTTSFPWVEMLRGKD